MADAIRYLGAWPHAGPPRLALTLYRARFALALIFLLCGGSLLCGQTPRLAPAVQFTVFSARPLTDVGFVPRANAAMQPLEFHLTSRSPHYEYTGPMPLRFVDGNSGQVVAEANIPTDMRNALLLFTAMDETKVTKGTLRYQIAVLDDSMARHPTGGLAIINLSGLVLSGTINGQAVTLKAGLNPTVTVGRSAKVQLNTVANGRSTRAYTNDLTLVRNQRALLILFPPFYRGSFEVQARLLIDQPPGTAAPAAGSPKAPAKR